MQLVVKMTMWRKDVQQTAIEITESQDQITDQSLANDIIDLTISFEPSNGSMSEAQEQGDAIMDNLNEPNQDTDREQPPRDEDNNNEEQAARENHLPNDGLVLDMECWAYISRYG